MQWLVFGFLLRHYGLVAFVWIFDGLFVWGLLDWAYSSNARERSAFTWNVLVLFIIIWYHLIKCTFPFWLYFCWWLARSGRICMPPNSRKMACAILDTLGWKHTWQLASTFRQGLVLYLALPLIRQALIKWFKFEAILESRLDKLLLLVIYLLLRVFLYVVLERHVVYVGNFLINGELNWFVVFWFGITRILDCPHLRWNFLNWFLIVV